MTFSSRQNMDETHTAQPLSEPPTAREYEQLQGKTGRQALYRPDRFTLRDLVEHPERFTLQVEDRTVHPRNFSLSGLSFRDRQGGAWEVGKMVTYSMELCGERVLEGEARVARLEDAGRHVEVGLTSAVMVDYESLRGAERDQAWRDGLRREQRIFGDPLPSAYRQAVLELSGFCQFYKNLLGRRELESQGDSLGIAQEAFASMQRGWLELSRKAADCAVEFLDDPEVHREARLVSEALVTPYLVEAPVLRRAYEKPLGYPGDYVVMQHYFDNGFEGDKAFGMVFHKITNEHPLSAGVRTRSEWMAALIRERAKRTNGSGPLRVLSLGCGIGAEVGLVHSGPGAVTLPVRWTLIDQEDHALSLAYRQARKISDNGAPAPQVSCVNVSFSRLFSGEVAPGTWGQQDVIFAMGLFDYLREPGASMLIAGLYSLLRDGGVVVIGNAAKPNSHFWEPELALRWSLLYRDREEMEGLGACLPSSATVHVEVESMGAYHILSCQKP
jgi:SAM-dependent methyltransferase